MWYLVFIFTLMCTAKAQNLNDFSGLNDTPIADVKIPTTVCELQKLIQTTTGPFSIAGGQYSQGGHTLEKNGIVIDIKQLCKISVIDPAKKTVTVQAGATWAQVQKAIDPYNLSLKVMQSYNDFTVGGSLSVNVHGRYLGHGPIIETVQEIKIMLANGIILTANRKQNSELFYGAIGGYGALGIIVEATLELTDNQKLERKQCLIPVTEYPDYFEKVIQTDPHAVLHNADLFPPSYTQVLCTTWLNTDKPVTCKDRLQYATYNPVNHLSMSVAKRAPVIQKARPLVKASSLETQAVVWRNYEASYGVIDLFYPKLLSVSLLQEYFIPKNKLLLFLKEFKKIVVANKVNIINVSLRHVSANNESVLSWSDKEGFAVVIFYDQMRFQRSLHKSDIWTRELIDAALSVGGTYYLPYRLSATQQQFVKAYPRIERFKALKKSYDPHNRFSNTFLEKMIL